MRRALFILAPIEHEYWCTKYHHLEYTRQTHIVLKRSLHVETFKLKALYYRKKIRGICSFWHQ